MIKNNKDLEALIAQIDIEAPLGLSDPANTLEEEDLLQIKEVYDRINYYKDTVFSEIPVSTIQDDIIYLQSRLVFLNHTTSRLVAYVQSLEDELKVARAKARNQVRKLQEAQNMRLTADDLKDTAYLATDELRIQLENYRQSAELCKYLYYGVKDQISYMEQAVRRAYRLPE